MDVKSLAKSKRAHSQHHSKKHHSKPTTTKAPPVVSGGATTANKPSGKGPGGQPHQSQSSKRTLPSNRDRYEEDYDSDLEDQPKSSTNIEIEGVVPKSKGSDYKYLLSEAKLQSEANISLDSFPSFDDLLSDFSEGFGSLLSARGENILSWTRDDNFVVEDKETTSCEASFLSLNFNLLAEQLEKVDLPTRLFIEPDLFATEMSSGDLKKDDEESDRAQVAIQIQETRKTSDEFLDSFSDTKFLDSFVQMGKNDAHLEQDEENLFKRESSSIFNKATVSNSQRDSKVAISFDDDLDDLLKETSASLSGRISSVQSTQSQPCFRGPDFSVPTLKTKNFDDDLDDLLAEKSSNIEPISVIPNYDDELDDLLKETSNKLVISKFDEMDQFQSQAASTSSGPTSKSKLSDDFDSFFDTL